MPSVQVAPFLHGLLLHSLMLISQLCPDVPGLQRHWYPLTRSWQLPPYWQGLESHSFCWYWQRRPIYPKEMVDSYWRHLWTQRPPEPLEPHEPEWQRQVKEFSPSIHSPWWHGEDWQSLMLVSQDVPVYPAGHSQVYLQQDRLTKYINAVNDYIQKIQVRWKWKSDCPRNVKRPQATFWLPYYSKYISKKLLDLSSGNVAKWACIPYYSRMITLL